MDIKATKTKTQYFLCAETKFYLSVLYFLYKIWYNDKVDYYYMCPTGLKIPSEIR